MFRKVLIISVLLGTFVLIQGSPRPFHSKRDDKFRPEIHYSVPQNWLNDPNGLVYLDGEYHMYYQYHPGSSLPGPKSWAHAISTDLVTWTDLPVAIQPDELGDIWSGSAVADFTNSSGFQTGSNIPILAIYTQSGQSQIQSISFSNDNGRSFTTYEENPVIPNPGRPDFRDPKAIRYNNESWIIVLANGDRINFYKSLDLKTWEFLSDFGTDPDQGLKGVWECPDFFPITFADQTVWVLTISNGGGGPNGGSNTQYFIGDFDGTQFVSSQMDPLWMDWGADNYASISFFNEPQNRRIMIGWMTNLDYANDIPTNDWRGQMTLPRLLELKLAKGQVRLASNPVPELKALFNADQSLEITNSAEIAADGVLALSDQVPWSNSLLYLDLTFDTAGLGPSASISICFMNNLEQEVCLGYDMGRERGIFLDRTRSGLTNFNPSFSRRLTAAREIIDESIRFEIYVDTVALDLYIDSGLTSMTSLFYPEEPYSRVEIRHHSVGNPDSRLTLTSALFQGLKSIH